MAEASGKSTAVEPKSAARAASLRYVNDTEPGFLRWGTGPANFTYLKPDGSQIRARRVLERIRKLAIPPAWTEVWICPDPDGHIQATGRDAKGRKQYRYHERWHNVRDESKYSRMIEFARALPRIRSRVEADLAQPGVRRDKVLAAIVRLLEMTLVRIGNDEYARANGSYGLTTLRDRHVSVNGSEIQFSFQAKSGKFRKIRMDDRCLAKVVRACQELPGQELFQYRDEKGRICDVTSSDVNAYIRKLSGWDFTAKDFRTWSGTVMAALALRESELPTTKTAHQRTVNAAVERVADMLGNTRAVCRKSYVHPYVFDAFSDGSLARALSPNRRCKSVKGLDEAEIAVLDFLCRGLKEQNRRSRLQWNVRSRSDSATRRVSTRRRVRTTAAHT